MDPSTSETEGMESGVLWPGLNTELNHNRKSWKKTSGRHQLISLHPRSLHDAQSLCVFLHLYIYIYPFD